MKITLDSSPSDAPCCMKLTAEDGRDLLIQMDWDWPGIAGTFGWHIGSVQRDYTQLCNPKPDPICSHVGTDGTVDCEECGVTAHDFIQAAEQWLRDHDGATAEDPGYFGEKEEENPVKIMMTAEDFPIEDWQHDVANGDTKLGYEAWVEHNLESANNQ